MINHVNLNFPDIEQINLPDGRLYKTPEGNKYPSITTVLGYTADKSWLEEWRQKVGDEEANKTSRRATLRGSALHKYCEDYLNNLVPEVSIFDLEQYNQFKKALVRINNVHGIECKVYSDRFETAGSIDLVAEFDGVLSICDWKTSKTTKSAEEICDYFIQTAFYAYCMYERFGLKISQVVIVMAVDGNKEPLIFKEDIRKWFPEFIKRRNLFKESRGF